MKRREDALDLGPDVVALLLPHRRPFLMVDRIEAYAGPTLWATRLISANEEVFAGHFPGRHLWPGVYTIEGLGQACNLHHVLALLEADASARGEDPGQVIGALQDLEAAARFTAPRSDRAEALLAALQVDPMSRMGLGARVDVKLLNPVFAGQKLDYRVTHILAVDGLSRFEVEASVSGQPVATGTMTGALGTAARA